VLETEFKTADGIVRVIDFMPPREVVERVPFVLTWRPSHLPPPEPIDPVEELGVTEGYWRGRVSACTYEGEWCDAVVRSLLTLKGDAMAATEARAQEGLA
jgi:hypothetical protein